ncbi:MAG TPA: hypothetical protein VHZ51_06235 [Ktedonobacteraceae bacterium]|nr:hypothetical protein [Ktedonobacteraceae bacterium]
MMATVRAKCMGDLFKQKGAGFHALVCRAPQHVVMLTGYQPILGNSFCLVSLNAANEGEICLAVPKGEEDRVTQGAAVEVKTFAEETMDYIGTAIEAVREPLAELVRSAHLPENAVIGYEGGHAPIATAYTQVGVPGPATLDLLHQLFLGGDLRDASSLLDELAAIKTDTELNALRCSEDVGRQGFMAARAAVRVGATEAEVAGATYAALLRAGYAAPCACHGWRAGSPGLSRRQSYLQRRHQTG